MSRHHHYIAESYQRNFTNEKFKVWVLTPLGKIFNSNPRNIFNEKDFYKIKFDDFPEPLLVENSLGEIENNFALLVRNKISKRIELNRMDQALLSFFCSGMLIRTKLCRKSIKNGLQEVLDDMEDLKSNSESKENLNGMTSFDDGGKSITYDDLKNGLKNFDSFHSLSCIETPPDLAPIIFHMNFILMIAPVSSEFISSDNPLVICSPERELKYGVTAIGSRAGLCHKDIELTLPLSSKVALCANWANKQSGNIYTLATEKQVDQINYRTMRLADNLIASKEEILRSILEKSNNLIK